MTFQYPKKRWSLPCTYHDHSTRMVDDNTPVVLSFDIQQLQVADCNTDMLGVQLLSEALLKRLALRQEGKKINE